MFQRLRILPAAVAVAGLALSGMLRADDAKKAEPKPKLKKIEVANLAKGIPAITLEVPKDWKAQKPASSMRIGQYETTRVEGDPESPILAIFAFPAGGSLRQNLPRWLREFTKVEKVAATKGTCPQGPYFVGDVSGAHVGSFSLKRSTPLKNGRLINIILTPEGKPSYYLKVTGPAKSVEQAGKDLRRALGADIKKEEKIDLEI